MSRILIVFYILYFPFVGFSQSSLDSAYFMRFADPYDKLIPNHEFPFLAINNFTHDSFAFYNDHSSRILWMNTIVIVNSGAKVDTMPKVGLTFSFDKESRITRVTTFRGDSSKRESGDIVYGKGNMISYMTDKNIKGEIVDSIKYLYNLSGNINSKCIISRYPRKDSVLCSQFFYNINGRLTKVENTNYHNHIGNFTYDYDEKGRIIRRLFVDGKKNGGLIWIDTLIYEISIYNMNNTRIKHSARILGQPSWTLIDEVIIDDITGKRLNYKIGSTRMGFSPTNMLASPNMINGSWNITYTYDSIGRNLQEVRLDSIGHIEKITSYIWGKQNLPDTMKIKTYEVKNGQRIITEEQVVITTYDQKGRILKIDDCLYEIVNANEKTTRVWYQKREKNFIWQ